jgi:hypothetical protein
MRMKLFAGILLLTLAFMSVPVLDVSAQEAKFELKDSSSIPGILKDRIGKRTIIRTQSGEDIEGTVVAVGSSLVYVSSLTGKEFYDAVISVDRISAVIMRVRNR